MALAERLRQPTPPLFVGLVMRSAPIVREVLRTVRSGEIGTIVSIDATEHLPPEHGAYLARNWRRKSEWGGSFLLDKVCHDFDILGAVAKRAPLRRVASFGGARLVPRPTGPSAAMRPAYRAWPGGWGAQDDPFSSDHDVTDTPDGDGRIRQWRPARIPCLEPQRLARAAFGTSQGPRAR